MEYPKKTNLNIPSKTISFQRLHKTNAAQNSNQRQSNVPVINGSGYGEGSTEALGFRQQRLIEEGEGDWKGRMRLMESGGE